MKEAEVKQDIPLKKERTKMNKYEFLVEWFLREMNRVINHLEDYDHIDDLALLRFDLIDILEWCEEEYKIEPNGRLKELLNHPDYKEFTRQKSFCCYDCEIEDPDYYMVKEEIWKEYGASLGQLCFKCLEKRMGRKLKVEDFTDCLVNNENEFVKNLRSEL